MDMREINSEIFRLEGTETNYQNCNRLAILYVVRDHLGADNTQQADGVALVQEQPLPTGSEFLDLVCDAPIGDVLRIIDEHLECVRVLYPKEYSAIMSKINSLIN